jgi:CRP/FNR family transcriptional regulator, cyclic AMP receptor protein
MNPQILETVDLFSDLNPEQLAKVETLCKEAVYLQGEVIFSEGSPSEEFFVILEGEVAIQVNPDLISPSSQHHEPGIIAILYAGQTFGEVALVDQGMRSASALCHSAACKTLAINCHNFMKLLKEDPAMGLNIMTNLATDLCTRIRLSNLNLREGLLYLPRKQY